MSSSTSTTRWVVATRLHLGQASQPPTDLLHKMRQFQRFCSQSCSAAVLGLIAVDATPSSRMPNYDLVQAVREACQQVLQEEASSSPPPPPPEAAENEPQPEPLPSTTRHACPLQVLPVTPWGKFVPALNALVVVSAKHESQPTHILFVSAETFAARSAMDRIREQVELTTSSSSALDYSVEDVLVVGAVLEGHDYRGSRREETGGSQPVAVPLTGRTSPWNTLALWNLQKLALTGFQLVSDGLLTDDATAPSYGIEEVVAVALLQTLLGPAQARAHLLALSPEDQVDWPMARETDPARQQWHQDKLKSKTERAQRQLDLLPVSGLVHHY